MTEAADVDAYISTAPAGAQPLLRELRRIVLGSAEGVVEKVRYGMPSYEYRGHRLVHFAAAKGHVGVYGLVHVDGEVPADLAPYLDHRSTLRFPFDRPLPTAALADSLARKTESLRASQA